MRAVFSASSCLRRAAAFWAMRTPPCRRSYSKRMMQAMREMAAKMARSKQIYGAWKFPSYPQVVNVAFVVLAGDRNLSDQKRSQNDASGLEAEADAVCGAHGLCLDEVGDDGPASGGEAGIATADQEVAKESCKSRRPVVGQDSEVEEGAHVEAAGDDDCKISAKSTQNRAFAAPVSQTSHSRTTEAGHDVDERLRE